MRVLVYLADPAHFHLFKNVVRILRQQGHHIHVVIKPKDVLHDLLNAAGWSYFEVRERGGERSPVEAILGLYNRAMDVFRVAREFKPDVVLGTSAEITHAAKILRIPSILATKDDIDVVPWRGWLSYPLASAILAPSVCRMGRWEKKKIAYEGYHELAYLHPDHFTPDEEVRRQLAPHGENFFILRFAEIGDGNRAGRQGITADVARITIKLLRPYGRVYISSERVLEEEFEDHRITIDPGQMHSALHFASMYIGDSQTMAAEAAILGTPSIRFNDFVGEINYLEELEHRYGLTCGISTDQPGRLFEKIKIWMRLPDLADEWKRRQVIMLSEKIDVAQFMTRLILNYGRPLPAQILASEYNRAPLTHH